MAELLVRRIDEELKRKLKGRAVRHGRSVEEEVRTILRDAVEYDRDESVGLGSDLAHIFSQLDFDPEIKELRGHLVNPITFES